MTLLALSLCRYAETIKELAVYQSLYNGYGLWIRPLALFLKAIESKIQINPLPFNKMR